MTSLTVTVQPQWGRARLEPSYADLSDVTKLFVYRVVAGVATLIRNGDPAVLSDGLTVLYDTEPPLDVPLHYRTVGYLNNNPFMETEITDYAATAATLERSRDRSHQGLYSLKLTPDGAGATSSATSDAMFVVVGTSYTASAWLYSPTGWSASGVRIDWYTAGLAFISSSSSVSAIPAGEWTLRTVTANAPATAAFANVIVTQTGTPPVTAVLFADEVSMLTPTSTVDSSVVTVSGEGHGWLKDPLHPAVDVRLHSTIDRLCMPLSGIFLVGLEGKSRRADAASYDVSGSALPVAQWATRKAPVSALRVFSRSIPDRGQLVALNASGGPLLMQLPGVYAEADVYILLGDIAENRLQRDHRVPWRLHSASYSEVGEPVGPSDGVFGTRYQDLDLFDTYAQYQAAGVTWLDVLQGEAAGP